MKVSWQVTGYVGILVRMLTGFRLRKISPIRKGATIHPDLYGQPQRAK